MGLADLARLTWESIRHRRLRAALTMLGIVIGIAAVVLLSGIGEGTRRFIAGQFAQFGTTLVSVLPGKSETMGGAMGTLAGTTRPLTLDDARAVGRLAGVRAWSAAVYVTARVEAGPRHRDVYCYGVTADAPRIWHWEARLGRFLAPGEPEQAPAVCTLGAKLARELFGESSPLGQPVRVGEARFRVVGVMADKGEGLGFDLDDAIFLPLVRAMRLFDRDELHEIHLDVANHEAIDRVVAAATRELTRRHRAEDFTVVSQQAALATIDNVLAMVTAGVVAIAAIAILVGAMGILTVTWLAVHERTTEIGVCKAVGASDAQVMQVILAEAVLLAGLGGLGGIALGLGLGWSLQLAVPALRVAPAAPVIPLALLVSVGVGALAGWLPARRAARLDPIAALQEE